MRGRVEPISDDVQTLMKERNISGERAANLQRQLAELLRYLHSEERQVNEWLGRLASLANMDMAADAKARKARWQARKVSEEQKEQQLKKASQTKQ